jgi:hypothetical protein
MEIQKVILVKAREKYLRLKFEAKTTFRKH